VGNADVLKTCLADLARVAPEDAATTWARALATEPAPFAIRFIRILVLLAFLGTMADALLRRERLARPPATAGSGDHPPGIDGRRLLALRAARTGDEGGPAAR
jgi:hypothetical protein